MAPTPSEPLWLLTLIGLLLALLPARWLLRVDRLTGYQLHRRAPDAATGLKRAQWFYRVFGLVLASAPWSFPLVTDLVLRGH